MTDIKLLTLFITVGFLLLIGRGQGKPSVQKASKWNGVPTQRINPAYESNIMMSCIWDVGDTLMKCEIIEKEDSSGDKVRELLVKLKAKNIFVKKIIYESHDYPIGMFPYGDSHGLLFTIWTSGSAYQIRIYRFINQEISCVFDNGSKIFPELVYDSEMLPCLIYTKSLSFNKDNYMRPDSCIIKRWYKGKYYSVGVFPWKERMQAIGLK